MKLILIALAIVLLTNAQTNVVYQVVYRDFNNFCTAGQAAGCHPDFQNLCYGLRTGYVKSALNPGTKVPEGQMALGSGDITSPDTFRQWYTDVPGLNYKIFSNLTFTKDSSGTYTYNNQNFFPIDGLGFNQVQYGHNFGFTMEMHTKFSYNGGEVFNLSGDDDIYVFINNQLALDLGGCHPTATGSINLDGIAATFGLTKGNNYDFDLYFAERHTTGSTIYIQTTLPLAPTPPPDTTTDTDGDGVPDISDNCKYTPNADQRDCDNNGIGDACDTKRGPLDFPFMVQTANANYLQTAPIDGLTTQFSPLTTTVTFPFTDPLPNKTINDQSIVVSVFFNNGDSVNCAASMQITSATGASDTKSLIIVPGNSTLGRSFDAAINFYNYKFTPFNGKSDGTGANVLTITKQTVTGNPCTNLKVGYIVVQTRYAVSDYINSTYFSACFNNVSCQYGTLRFGGYCACWSGAYGRSCTMDTAVPATSVPNAWAPTVSNIQNIYAYDLDTANANRPFYMDWANHPTCSNLANWGKVDTTVTKDIPNLDSAFFSNSRLDIVVSQHFVNGRADGVAFLNDNTINKTNPQCTYPISNDILKQVVNCTDVWYFNIPWTTASQCKWTTVQQDGFLVYRGQVIIQNNEWLGNVIAEWRVIQSVLRIKLRFQQYVQVTVATDPTVFSAKGLNAAITKQIVAINLGSPALVELVTVFNYPYYLTSGDLTLTPPGKVANYTYAQVQQCTPTLNANCRQRWDATMQLTQETCTLTGDYRMSWSTTCPSTLDQTTCPLLPADVPTYVNFSLTSENFCAEITVDVGLTGAVASYSDSAFSNPKSAFIVGRTAYFLVSVNSELNNGGALPYSATGATVTFSATSLVTVTVTPKPAVGTLVYRLYENSATANFTGTSYGDLQTLCTSIPGPQPNQVGFSFVFSTALSANLTQNGAKTFTVSATVKVTYSNSAGKKRGVLVQSGDNSNTYSADFTPDTTATGTDTTLTTSGGSTGSSSGSSGSGSGSSSSSSSSASSSSSGSNGIVIVASLLFVLISLLI